MKRCTPITILCLAILGAVLTDSGANAEASAASSNNSEFFHHRMFVDPASTKVSLGKVKLIVGPLTYNKGTFVGDYQIEVIPYFYKNEKGTLLIFAPADVARKLSMGKPTEFTGKATNPAKARTKLVKGKVTPSSNARGVVTFSISTLHGEMVFDTFYHFAK